MSNHEKDFKQTISYDEAKLEEGQINTIETTTESQTRLERFKNSFKPADLSQYEDQNLTPVEKAALATANSPLSRSLKGRHLQMIAIGGSIGTGLFVGSGKALSNGGPASLLIAFSLIGIMLYCTIQALGELSVRFPVSGAFATFSTLFIYTAW